MEVRGLDYQVCTLSDGFLIGNLDALIPRVFGDDSQVTPRNRRASSPVAIVYKLKLRLFVPGPVLAPVLRAFLSDTEAPCR